MARSARKLFLKKDASGASHFSPAPGPRPPAPFFPVFLGHLTQGISPDSISSWALDSLDSNPIGDCASRILELQLQFGRNCREGISAHSRSRNYTGFVRLHFNRTLHRQHYSGTLSKPAPVLSFGALGGIFSPGAVGLVLLSAVLCFGCSAVRSFTNGYSK